MRKITRWEAMVQQNPGHSRWYVERFRTMAAQGNDLAGEARMIDAMVGRGSRKTEQHRIHCAGIASFALSCGF